MFHVKRLATAVLLAPIRAYRRWVSPAFPRRCRYHPTCSAYAEQALRELGPVRGAIVAGWRLLRCNPFSPGGYDPLEARRLFKNRAHPSASLRDMRAGGATTAPTHQSLPDPNK